MDQQQRRPAAFHPVEDVKAEVVEVRSGSQRGRQLRVHGLSLRNVADDALGQHTPGWPTPRSSRGRHRRLYGAVPRSSTLTSELSARYLLPDRHRRREANLVQAVVDGELDAVDRVHIMLVGVVGPAS